MANADCRKRPLIAFIDHKRTVRKRPKFVDTVRMTESSAAASLYGFFADQHDSPQRASAMVACRAINCQPVLRFAQTSVNGLVTCLPAPGPFSGTIVS